LADYEKMATVLAGIHSRFILSINDHPDIREVFKKFTIKPVTLNYSVSKGKQTLGRELLITNS
jgi:DNA adenine methylase